MRVSGDRPATGKGSASWQLRKLAFMSMAVALAAAGSLIKLPSPVGTVALDSWPGYLCALIVGPEGAWVALAGHLASGFVAGFPLGLVLHAAVAIEMALCALAFRWATSSAGAVLGAIVAVVLNGVAAPVALLPWLGRPLVLSLILPLSLAAGVNVALAAMLYRALGSRLAGVSGQPGLWRSSGNGRSPDGQRQ